MQGDIAIHIVQLLTVDTEKKQTISYLNINYIYRMCNICKAFYICN